MSDGREWRWVDPSGGQHVWRVEALRNALQSGSLPPNTLVWCEGMTDWLPASQVPELSPGLSVPEVRPAQPTLPGPGAYVESDAAPVTPPGYGNLKTKVGVPVDPAVGGSWSPPSSPRDVPPNAGTTLLGVPPPSPGSGPMPPTMARGPIHGSQGSSPAPAQPPAPPRAPAGKGKTMVMGQPILDPSKVGHPIVVPGYQATGGKITQPAPFSDEAAEVRVPRAPLPPAELSGLVDEGPSAAPPGGEASLEPGQGPQAGAAGRAEQGASVGKRIPPVAVVGGVLGLGTLVLIGAVVASLAGRTSEPPSESPPASSAPSGLASAPAASAPASGSGAPSPAAAGSAAPSPGSSAGPKTTEAAGSPCSVLKAARRLAPKASRDIPLELVVLPGGAKAALGYSIDGRSGQGLEIDVSGLGAGKLSPPRAAGRLRRVLPVPSGNKVKLLADVDAPKSRLQRAQTVPLEPSFLVGLEPGGAVATAERATSSPQSAWSLPGDVPADLVKALAMPGEGALVAVKTKESAFAGLLGADRSAKGELSRLVDAGQVGTPSLAGAGGVTAAALAYRASDAEPWAIRLARGEGGSPPGKAQPFATPAGGPGQDAMGPSIAALPGGRWLLAWTEGKPGARVVRAATLGPSFELVGEPVAISLPDGNAGQAVAASADGKAVVVYLMASGKNFELWGASLSCP